MAFEPLEFTKNWRNANDFPTYEPDEQQVREDLQFLYDEIRDFINNKLVALLNTGGAENISTTSGKSVEAVLAELQKGLGLMAGGTIPEEGSVIGWDLNLGGYRVLEVAPPTDSTDAANKAYVDAQKNKVTYVTLPAAGWDADTLTQTVTVPGVLPDPNEQKIDLFFADIASSKAWVSADVWCESQAAYSLTFSCGSIPVVDIRLIVEIKEVTVI